MNGLLAALVRSAESYRRALVGLAIPPSFFFSDKTTDAGFLLLFIGLT